MPLVVFVFCRAACCAGDIDRVYLTGFSIFGTTDGALLGAIPPQLVD